MKGEIKNQQGRRNSMTFRFKNRELILGKRPVIMGILNVTPDSFSDGGVYYANPDAALQQASAMVENGADIIDVGGESTRPGAVSVPASEETKRILPVIKVIKQDMPDIILSVDTRKPQVADAALSAGADIVNDVSGIGEQRMAEVIASHRAGAILMHMRGIPENMQRLTHYDDVAGDICTFFKERLDFCEKSGIDLSCIVLDPGIGFGKTARQNLDLIAATGVFRELGRPVLMGPSRKSFIGKILNQPSAQNRVWGTAAAIALCVYQGADILRVHDVREMRDAALVAAAIRDKDDEL